MILTFRILTCSTPQRVLSLLKTIANLQVTKFILSPLFQSCYIPGKECRTAVLFKGPGKFVVIFRKDISDHNCVITIVRLPGKTSFYFISLYLACSSSSALQDQLDRLDNCLSLLDNSLPIIICSDTNCRSAQWGDNYGKFSMDRANRLTEFLTNNDLFIRNCFREAPFSNNSGTARSVIDMIITNDSPLVSNSKCYINTLESPTDHQHLLLTNLDDSSYNSNENCNINTSIKYNNVTDDWTSFNDALTANLHILSGNLNSICDHTSANRAVNKIAQIFKAIL